MCLKEIHLLRDRIAALVRGQPTVLDRISNTIQRRETKVVPQRGPRGSFIFAGPTGVGKTLLAKTIADVIFGPNRLVRFDCSEFKTLSSYESLFGNRNGDIGRIGQAHARCSDAVWLFDEIEKAHPEFVHLFLQAADAARATLADGRTLDLSGIYIILTTNLGSAAIIDKAHLPFASLERHVAGAVENWLRPELRGRFGRPYVFRPLDRKAQSQIAAAKVDEIIQWNEGLGRKITVEEAVIPYLVRKGFSRRLGARPLLEIIDEVVGDPIKNDLLVAGGSGSGRLVVTDRLQLLP